MGKTILTVSLLVLIAAFGGAAVWYFQGNKEGEKDLILPADSIDYTALLESMDEMDYAAPIDQECQSVEQMEVVIPEASGKPVQILTAKASYNCDDDKSIFAQFYKGEATKAKSGQMPKPTGSAGISLGAGKSLELVQTISADGGRYANSDESFVFWDKGDVALVLENGAEKNYVNCKIDNSNPSNSVAPAAAESPGGITVGNEYRGYFEKWIEYYYPIGGGAEIYFVFQNSKKCDNGPRWSGNAILKKDNHDFVLLENIPISGPGDGLVSVWATNDPNILLLRHSDGDLGWMAAQDYYLDLTKNKIVFRLLVDGGIGIDNFAVQKDNGPEIKLNLMTKGECGDAGQKTQAIDLALNGKGTNVLESPIEADCIETGVFGYASPFDIEQTKIESDFSKVHFVLTESKNEKDSVIKKFYIPLNDPGNIKIYPEN